MDVTRQQVAVRVRPLIKREIESGLPMQWVVKSNQISRPDGSACYVFDKVFGPEGTNSHVYHSMVEELVHSSIKGINGTVFAYGQTASGKTYTMSGLTEEPGIIKHAVDDLFCLVEQASDRNFLISMLYTEIYNEDIRDLLGNKSNLRIRETEDGVVYAENCEQQLVENADDFVKLMSLGNRHRHVGATTMNEKSSRSHAIATLMIESKLKEDGDDGAVLVSQLNFVDLAGSEKAGQTGAVGQRLKEGSHINTSLLTLSNCINKLAENGSHIPYRDSKLTRLLKNSIGGNSKTAVVASVAPASVDETLSTLRFASRAKKVSTKPQVNEVVDERTLTKRLQRKVNELEQQLAQKAHLDQEAKHALIRELLRTEPVEDISAKQRRMTWCAPKMGGPLLGCDTLAQTEKCYSIDSGEVGGSTFKRPPFPRKVTHRRKRPVGSTSNVSLPAMEEEVFMDASKVLPEFPSLDDSGQSAAGPRLSSVSVQEHSSSAVRDSLQATITELKCQVERLTKERKSLADAMETAAVHQAELQQAKDMAQADVSAAEHRARAAEERAASAEKKVASADEKAASAEEKVASAEEKAASAEEKAASAEEKAASAEEKAASAEEKAASAEEKAASAEANVVSVTDNYESKLTELDDLRKEVERRSNYDEICSELEALRKGQEGVTEQQMLDLATKLMEAEQKVKKLTEEKRKDDRDTQAGSTYQTELNNLKEELVAAHKSLKQKDDDIVGLKQSYARLCKEQEELLQFHRDEGDVWATRTPGQIVEKRLRLEIIQIQEDHKNAMAQVQASAGKLAEENYRLKQRLGERVSLSAGLFALSPVQERNTPLSDIPLCNEVMPDVITTPEGSPSLPPPRLHVDTSGCKAQVIDVGVNTDIDIKWFDLDDTVLGVKKTGAITDTCSSPSMPTPAKRLVCEVTDNVAELKAGLQTAYNMIADLTEKSEQDKKYIKDKEEEVLELMSILSEQKELMDDLQAAVGRATDEKVESQSQYEEKLSRVEQSLREEMESLQRVNSSTSEQLKMAEQEVIRLRNEHGSELEELRVTFEGQIAAMTSKHLLELEGDRLSHVEEKSWQVETKVGLESTLSDSSKVGGDGMAVVKEMEDLRSEHQQQMKSLKTRHEEELNTVCTQVREMEEQVIKLAEEVMDKKLQLEKLTSKLSADERRHAAQCESAEREIERLEKLLTEMTTHDSSAGQKQTELMDELQAAVGRATDDKVELQSQYEEKLSRVEQSLREEMESLQRVNSSTSEQLKMAEQEVIRLRNEHGSELEELRVTFEGQIAAMTSKHSLENKSQKELMNELQAAVGRATDEKVELQSQYEEKLSRVEQSLREEMESLQRVNSSTSEQLKMAEQEVIRLRSEHSSELEELRVTFEGQIAAMTSKHLLENQSVEQVKVESLEMEKLLAEMSAGKAELAAKFEAAEMKIKELEGEVCELRKQASAAGTSQQSEKRGRGHEMMVKDLRREIKRLNLLNADLQKKVDNPDLMVREAQEAQEDYKNDSERYHDILVQIDYKIQEFGEEYFGYAKWDIDALREKILPYLPENLKEPAKESVRKVKSPSVIIGDSYGWGTPKKVEDTGELCEHLRRRQHFKIVELESCKAGLEFEVSKLQKEIKELNKVHKLLHEEKQNHYKLKQEYASLQDLLRRTEQELSMAKETASAQPHMCKSSLSKLPESNIHVQMKIKGLECEKYTLSMKLKQCEETLDKLRHKYVVLREKHDKISGNATSKRVGSENVASAPLFPSEISTSAGEVKREASQPVSLNTDLGLDDTSECNTQ